MNSTKGFGSEIGKKLKQKTYYSVNVRFLANRGKLSDEE